MPLSRLKAFVSKSVYAVASAPPVGMEAVAVFFLGAPPTVADITALATEAEIAVSNSEGKTRITLTWPEANLTITIDSAWDKAAQMEGMRGWVDRFPSHIKELEGVKTLLACFDQVTGCYGSVTRPGLDADEKPLKLLKALIAAEGGFFFSRNAFYDANGLRITGYDDAPACLGNSAPAM